MLTALDATIDRFDFVEPRSALKPPRTLGDGSRVFEVVVATPGIQRYGHGDEYVPPETLADETYRRSLVGIPVLEMEGRHPPRFVYRADTKGAREIGRVISERWDAEVGNICEVVIPKEADEQMVRTRFRYVSLGYRIRPGPAGVTPDGRPYATRQDARYDVNHLVVTHSPRAGQGAQFRTDTLEIGMTPEELAKAIKDALAPLTADLAAIKERQDAALKAPERADTAADWRAVLDVAKATEVKIEAGDTLAAAAKRVADKVMPERGDAVSDIGACRAFHIAAASAPAGSVWGKIKDEANGDGARRDDTNTGKLGDTFKSAVGGGKES